MSCYFISRHPGAVDWAEASGIHIDQCLNHLDLGLIQAGDWVIGTLPVNMIAAICQRGGRYQHLVLELSVEMRGRELSAEDMKRCNARLVEYRAEQVDNSG